MSVRNGVALCTGVIGEFLLFKKRHLHWNSQIPCKNQTEFSCST